MSFCVTLPSPLKSGKAPPSFFFILGSMPIFFNALNLGSSESAGKGARPLPFISGSSYIGCLYLGKSSFFFFFFTPPSSYLSRPPMAFFISLIAFSLALAVSMLNFLFKDSVLSALNGSFLGLLLGFSTFNFFFSLIIIGM